VPDIKRSCTQVLKHCNEANVSAARLKAHVSVNAACSMAYRKIREAHSVRGHDTVVRYGE
jgi:hypothetical protein